MVDLADTPDAVAVFSEQLRHRHDVRHISAQGTGIAQRPVGVWIEARTSAKRATLHTQDIDNACSRIAYRVWPTCPVPAFCTVDARIHSTAVFRSSDIKNKTFGVLAERTSVVSASIPVTRTVASMTIGSFFIVGFCFLRLGYSTVGCIEDLHLSKWVP